jgi:disulfide bond formation protein DsbB
VGATAGRARRCGSLYFSEVAELTPCTLCWYQRIAMYSLAIILTVATVRRDRGIALYAVVLATLGALVSVYHYLLEWKPSLDTGSCKLSVPCSQVWFREFGFITLPLMALCGFVAVIALMTVGDRS